MTPACLALISPEGVAFLAETSWPISTLFCLWLEPFNEVPNAPSASGPARDFPPEFVAFRRATELLQYFQERNALDFRRIEVEVRSVAKSLFFIGS